MEPPFRLASTITATWGETTWSEILDLRPRILRATTDARLDAKRGTSDQRGSPGRTLRLAFLSAVVSLVAPFAAAAAPIPLYNIGVIYLLCYSGAAFPSLISGQPSNTFSLPQIAV